MRFAQTKSRYSRTKDILNVGFAATIDCAIVIAAQELRLFDKYGLKVRLSQEVGWATIREKILHEELDAAAAHASMLLSIYCGIGVVRRACLTGLFLGLNGSAITLSNELWDLGVRDAASLGRLIREQKDSRTFTFAVVQELSSQNYNLRKWLASGGIDPDKDVRVAIVPSALVYDTYLTGHLDGYCVAEPWNSAASLSGTGWVVSTTSEIEPRHPEKVLLVLQEFARRREEEHVRLLAALIEASQFCDVPANRPELARILAQSKYFDVDKRLLANALVGPFDSGRGRRAVKDFVLFDALSAGAPSRDKAKWVFDLARVLGPNGACPALRPEILGKIFRNDIFEQAAELARASTQKNNPAPPPPPFFSSGMAANKPHGPHGSTTRPLVQREPDPRAPGLLNEAPDASLKTRPSESSPALCT